MALDDLFGKYTVPTTELFGNGDGDRRRIAFLYGDNGSGKTTALKLIYAALSNERNAGLRGYLARTKFSTMTLTFADGQTITITKDGGELSGPFWYIFAGPRVNDRLHFRLNEHGRVGRESKDAILTLNEHLSILCSTIVFVNDQRTIRSNYQPWDVRSYLNARLERGRHNSAEVYSPALRPDIDTVVGSGLDHLLDETHRLFVSKAITGNVEANHSSGQIYLNIARTLSRPSGVDYSPGNSDSGLFKDRIQILEHQLGVYEKYRIIEGQPLKEIGSVVRKTPARAMAQLMDVIEPYIASLEKRVDANRQLLDMAFQFEHNVNAFLTRKRMNFTLESGIQFVDDSGDIIEPQDLSSGERHLLYLFSASLLSRERNSIIIVDEPELSLNYKWQRLLVGALLEIAGEGAQFLMATHSFEIISKYKDAVHALDPRS
ncbi:MAG: AAA family ATPase [Brevundimonas sp.]